MFFNESMGNYHMVTETERIEQQLQDCSGVVPVLSLEEHVLLPQAMQLLRISDPQDCLLVKDALAANSLIAVDVKQICQQSGEVHSPGNEIRSVCLASIVSPCQLESGHYSVMVRGVSRARSVNLLKSDLPYQTALVELKPDYYPAEPVIHREHRQLELIEHYTQLFMGRVANPVYYHHLHRDIEFGKLCDILANSMTLEPPLVQLILSEQDVDQRSDLLLSFLKSIQRQQRRDPAAAFVSNDFSLN